MTQVNCLFYPAQASHLSTSYRLASSMMCHQEAHESTLDPQVWLVWAGSRSQNWWGKMRCRRRPSTTHQWRSTTCPGLSGATEGHCPCRTVYGSSLPTSARLSESRRCAYSRRIQRIQIGSGPPCDMTTNQTWMPYKRPQCPGRRKWRAKHSRLAHRGLSSPQSQGRPGLSIYSANFS